MEKSNIKLLYGIKEWSIFLLVLSSVFAFNLKKNYDTFSYFKHNELFQTQAAITNIYPKDDFLILKLQTNEFTFFTSVPLLQTLKQFDQVDVMIVTTKTTFLDFLKGFYAPSINVYQTGTITNTKTQLSEFIAHQHELKLFKELYNALFFAVPISKELRDICASFGINNKINFWFSFGCYCVGCILALLLPVFIFSHPLFCLQK